MGTAEYSAPHPSRFRRTWSDTEGMLGMNDAQVWTTIGVLASGMYATITLMATMFVRIIKTEIGTVRTEIGGIKGEIGGIKGEIGGIKGEIGGIKGEIAGVKAEIGDLRKEVHGLSRRMDGLDRDVSAISRHLFGSDPA